MARIFVMTDLDGTIIHSAKAYAEGDVLVDFSGSYKGYMHRSTVDAIRAITGIATIVAVTSRSIEQYLRIKWPRGASPDEAIVTNGANLLSPKDGVMVTAPLVDCSKKELWKQDLDVTMRRIRKFECVQKARVVDDSYVLAILNEETREQDHPACLDVETRLQVLREGKKVYCFPSELNKSIALAYAKRKAPDACVFAAGDTPNDVPLLRGADRAFAPAALKNHMTDDGKTMFIEDENFERSLMTSILDSITSISTACVEGGSDGI